MNSKTLLLLALIAGFAILAFQGSRATFNFKVGDRVMLKANTSVRGWVTTVYPGGLYDVAWDTGQNTLRISGSFLQLEA